MKKDRLEYLLSEMIDIIDTMNKVDLNKISHKSTYDIIKNEISDKEMEELEIDIKYLKG